MVTPWRSTVNGLSGEEVWVPEGYQLLPTSPDRTQSESIFDGVVHAFRDYLPRGYPAVACGQDSVDKSHLYDLVAQPPSWLGPVPPAWIPKPTTTIDVYGRPTFWMPPEEWIDGWARAGAMVLASFGAAQQCNLLAQDGSRIPEWALAAVTPDTFRQFKNAGWTYLVALPNHLSSSQPSWAYLAPEWLGPPPAQPDPNALVRPPLHEGPHAGLETPPNPIYSPGGSSGSSSSSGWLWGLGALGVLGLGAFALSRRLPLQIGGGLAGGKTNLDRVGRSTGKAWGARGAGLWQGLSSSKLLNHVGKVLLVHAKLGRPRVEVRPLDQRADLVDHLEPRPHRLGPRRVLASFFDAHAAGDAQAQKQSDEGRAVTHAP